MTRYPVQPRNRRFVKGHGFLSFAKNMVKILVKIKVKSYAVNIATRFLIMLNNLQQMCLKLLQKEQLKKQQKQLVVLLVIKLLIELQKFQKIHNKIIKKQLQISMINKYLKKDIYPEKRQEILMN